MLHYLCNVYDVCLRPNTPRVLLFTAIAASDTHVVLQIFFRTVCGDEDMKGRTSVVNGTASLKTFKNEDIKDLRLIMQWVSVGGTILTLLASCAFLDAAG